MNEPLVISHNNFAHMGDIISLFAEDSSSSFTTGGFINSLGQVDNRCIVQPLSGDLKQVPRKYRDCLFKVMPQMRYSAQRQYWAQKRQTRSSSNSSSLGCTLIEHDPPPTNITLNPQQQMFEHSVFTKLKV